MPQKNPKPKIEDVTRAFGKAHAAKAAAEATMKKFRQLFFDLIEIPEEQLARQSIYIDRVGDTPTDPEVYVATLYPKWKILSKQRFTVDEDGDTEWKLIIQEDPEKKSYTYINPIDGLVYTHSVAESAPSVDMERLKSEDPHLWQTITFQPPLPERQLKPLDDLTEVQKDKLRNFLTPPALQHKMLSPRKPKPEELEGQK